MKLLSKKYLYILLFFEFCFHIMPIWEYNVNNSHKGIEFPPSNSDDDTIIECYFEGNTNDEHGHSISSYGNWDFESNTPIVGDYSIYQTANSRYYKKWRYTTDLPEGTIETFFKPTDVDFVDAAMYIMTIDYGDSATGRVYLSSDGTICAGHRLGSEWFTQLVSTTILKKDTLYHLAYTWGPRGTELWINNILESSSSETGGLSSASIYFGIGKGYTITSGSRSAIGIWDEFKVSKIQRNSFDINPNEITHSSTDPTITNTNSDSADSGTSYTSSDSGSNSFQNSGVITIGIIIFLIFIGTISYKRYNSKNQATISEKNRNSPSRTDTRLNLRNNPQKLGPITRTLVVNNIIKVENRDKILLEKFKSILEITQEVEIARSLKITEDTLFEKLLIWKKSIPCKIKGKLIVVENLDNFMNALDDQFTDWNVKEDTQDGKI